MVCLICIVQGPRFPPPMQIAYLCIKFSAGYYLKCTDEDIDEHIAYKAATYISVHTENCIS